MIDFINTLPKSLQIRIPSFSPTKGAIRISTLCKTQKRLQIHLPRIKICRSDFNRTVSNEIQYESMHKILLIYKALKLHKLFLDLLEVPYNSFPPLIKLLQFVIDYHVEKLSLYLCNFELPKDFYMNSIISKLSLCFGHHLPNTLSQMTLRILKISLTYVRNNFLIMLLLGCLVLEFLKLDNYFDVNIELNITYGLLKELVLQSLISFMRETKICAPNLLELSLNGNCFWRLRLIDVSSLVS